MLCSLQSNWRVSNPWAIVKCKVKLQGVSHQLGLGVLPENKYFHYILEIYEFHIYWYIFRHQGCQLFIDPIGVQQGV